MPKRDPQFHSGENADRTSKGLYGLDPETSLLSSHFSPPENPYLNEHYEEINE